MVDWRKRIEKISSDQLDAGEEVIVGLPVQPAGYVVQQAGMVGVGGLLGLFAGNRAQKRRSAETVTKLTEKAATFLNESIILALSNRRVLPFKQNKLSGKPENLISSYEISEVSGTQMERRKVSISILITFDDQSVVDLDSMKGQKVEPLIQAFEDLKN